MKIVFTILMAIFGFVAWAQRATLYRMDMAVLFIDSAETYRFDTASVLWGTVGDTLCFDLEKERNFYPIKISNFAREERERISKLTAWINKRDENHFLLQDDRNDIYYIRFISNLNTGDLLIYITNVGAGFPNYFLSRVNK